jgi:hypothetical protein
VRFFIYGNNSASCDQLFFCAHKNGSFFWTLCLTMGLKFVSSLSDTWVGFITGKRFVTVKTGNLFSNWLENASPHSSRERRELM